MGDGFVTFFWNWFSWKKKEKTYGRWLTVTSHGWRFRTNYIVVALVFDGWNMSKSVKSTLCYCVWKAWFNLILPILQVAMVFIISYDDALLQGGIGTTKFSIQLKAWCLGVFARQRVLKYLTIHDFTCLSVRSLHSFSRDLGSTWPV